jgi:hypothetical protein
MKKEETKITISVGELCDKYCWDDYCEKYGVNVWCMNEGLATIWVWYNGKLAYKFASKYIKDINRVINNLAPGFTWTGKMINKY